MKEDVYKNDKGEFHRKDGPAWISSSGTQIWYINGLRHREDGPAVVYKDGRQLWLIKGKLHREDGPAYIYADGEKFWFLDGIQYSVSTYYKELYRRGKITEGELFLKLL
jgi:hypothetical protein